MIIIKAEGQPQLPLRTSTSIIIVLTLNEKSEVKIPRFIIAQRE